MPNIEACVVSSDPVAKDLQEEKDLEWITGGSVGSREAVLVFRTNILNPKTRKSLSNRSSVQSLVDTTISRNMNAELNNDNKCGSSGVVGSGGGGGGGGANHHHTNISNNNNNNSNDVLDALIESGVPLSPDGGWNEESLSRLVLKDKQSLQSEQHQRKLFISTLRYVDKNSTNNVNGKFSQINESLILNDNSMLNNSGGGGGGGGGGGYDVHKAKPLVSKWSIKQNHIFAQQVGSGNETAYSALQAEDSNDEYNEKVEDDQEEGCDGEEYKECGLNMPAHKLKICYKFFQTETKLLRKIFNVHGLTEVHGDEHFSILWTGVPMKLDILRSLTPYQRVNHFPRSYELTRKDRLYKNIERMQHLRGMRHFDIVPQSFILPVEYKDLVVAHNKHRGPWIVKPAASSRGRGIFIVNSPDQIPPDEQGLVSKYLIDPLCIDGHKCDLRLYVLITSFDPLIIYIYEEGIVRLATVKYDRNSEHLWNPCMHLCNYSINKYHSDYIRSSDAHDEDVGHKWTLSALLRHLKLQGCDTRLLMYNIEDLIIKSILACAQTIIAACRMFVPSGNNCFELYGFDILIDDTLKPWLLEVNLSPSMGVDSPLDTKVKASLITDLLTLVGIPAYGPELRRQYDTKWTRFRSTSCSKKPNVSESVVKKTKHSRSKEKPNLVPQLTLEEQRIIRNARFQYTRRGGFVRIFPTADTFHRYGQFLDPTTGIPLSTATVQGQTFQSLNMQHNYNLMLHKNLNYKCSRSKKCDNTQSNRMNQYERVLETDSEIPFVKKKVVEKCEEERKRLRKQILSVIGNGSELTQFQARQTFSKYLESVLRRLSQDPKDGHEKLILKFLSRYGGTVKPSVHFRNPQGMKVVSKARSAMVAKLLGDFLELYKRDTEAYVDSFDHFGMIPSSIFNQFLSQAQESDLADVLTLHTSLTGIMPYLYNRCGLSVPATPPIPSGLHGFLRALPAMVASGAGAREFSKYDGYFKSFDKDCDIMSDGTLKSRNAKKL